MLAGVRCWLQAGAACAPHFPPQPCRRGAQGTRFWVVCFVLVISTLSGSPSSKAWSAAFVLIWNWFAFPYLNASKLVIVNQTGIPVSHLSKSWQHVCTALLPKTCPPSRYNDIFSFKRDISELQKWVGKLSVYQLFDLFIKLFEFCEFVSIGRSNFEIGWWCHFHVIL